MLAKAARAKIDPPRNKVMGRRLELGLDIQTTRFLLRAKKAGVVFTDVATLGRQNLSLRPADLLADAQRSGLGELADDVEAIYADFPYADGLLRRLGAVRLDAIDASDYEGANVTHDMNQPLPADLAGRYDCVIDGGTMEHVFDVPRMVRNIAALLRVDGRLISVNGANNLMGHGFYQFSPEFFFRVFSPENGFVVEEVMLAELHAPTFWRRVEDPAKVGRRLQIANIERTYVMARVRKTVDVDLFVTAPQQSDYEVTAWQGQAKGHAAPPKLGPINGRRKGAAGPLARLNRALGRVLRDPYSAAHLSRIDWAT